MAHHQRHRSVALVPDFPMIPFLAIMLGIMSVMALNTLGFSVERRQEQKRQAVVELVGVPDGFLPVNLRCQEHGVLWQDTDGEWRGLTIFGLFALLPQAEGRGVITDEAVAFLNFLRERAQDNRRLSFAGRQHTLLLWVEPAGVVTAQIIQELVSHHKLPLRVGQLPLLPRERIRSPYGPADDQR